MQRKLAHFLSAYSRFFSQVCVLSLLCVVFCFVAFCLGLSSRHYRTVAKANLLTSIAGDLLRSSLMRHIPSVWTDRILSIDPLEPVSSSSSSAEGSSEETSRLDSEKMTPSWSSVLDLADQLARDGESCSWWWLRSKNSAVRFVEDVYPSIDQQLDSIVLCMSYVMMMYP